MKKALLLFLSVAAFNYSYSQGCNNVFISELVEGWSNNKAVEIYNPTANPIDVSDYGLVRFQNGSTSFGEISYLTGVTIPAYDVVVVVLEKLDSLGEELEAPVWEELQEVADLYINPNYDDGIWPMYFNGNDAVALVTDDGETLVDLFGRIGEGTEFAGWGPYIDSEGVQSYISADHTLIRKSNILTGQNTNPAVFDILEQWDSLPANTFDYLGVHACGCNIDFVENELSSESVRIYPNPVSGTFVSVVAERPISSIAIYNELGALIRQFENVNDIMFRIEMNNELNGIMMAEITLSDGSIVRQRLVR